MSGAHERLEFVSTLTTSEVEERHPVAWHRATVDTRGQSGCMSECRPVTVFQLHRVVSVLTYLACVVALNACGTSAPAAPAHLVERSHVSMGTSVQVSAWTADEAAAVAAFETVFDEFDRLDALMSVWKEGSDVLRINAAAGKTAVPVSPEVREVLRASQEVSEWTGGKFDVTFGALSGLWKFDHDLDGQIPDRAEIARTAAAHRLPGAPDRRTGWHCGSRSRRDESASGRHRQGLRDRPRGDDPARCAAQGLHDPVRGRSVRRRSPRRSSVASRHSGSARRAGHPFAAMELTDAAFSTSGDYERFFIRDGHRYHHILDPDTGEPAPGSRSVTIMAKTATRPDGLSTGVFILGAEEGMALIEKLPASKA